MDSLIVIYHSLKLLYMNLFNRTPSSYRPRRSWLPVVVIAFCLGASFLFTGQVRAQGSQQAPSPKGIQLSPDQLKPFEGYFQNPQNKEMVMQFAAKGNSLTAIMLWANREFKLASVSDSSFQTVDLVEGHYIPVNFKKGDQGGIDQVAMNNDNMLWTRVNNYKPLVRVEMEHNPEQLKVFEGLYELHGENGRFIQFKEKDNTLVLRQYWDGREIPFVPDSADHFFWKEQRLFTLKFNKDANGNPIQVVAFGRDYWDKVKKPEFTAVQLRSFEGKYQMKDDKDNLIRITARDGKLVIQQLWDGKEIVVAPVGPLFFYGDAQSYSASFNKDKDGAIAQVTLLDTDLFEKVKE
jgi:hypothetical protein